MLYLFHTNPTLIKFDLIKLKGYISSRVRSTVKPLIEKQPSESMNPVNHAFSDKGLLSRGSLDKLVP